MADLTPTAVQPLTSSGRLPVAFVACTREMSQMSLAREISHDLSQMSLMRAVCKFPMLLLFLPK
jgi:hypothetical protein